MLRLLMVSAISKSPYEMAHFLKGHVCLLGTITIDVLVVSSVSCDRSKRYGGV